MVQMNCTIQPFNGLMPYLLIRKSGNSILPCTFKMEKHLMFPSRQFLYFAAVGTASTAVQYVILWVGVEIFAAPAAISSAAGYALGSVVNYLLNYFFTFKSDQSHVKTAPKYYTVLSIGWCINFGLMELLAHRMGWNYWLAQVCTTGICLMWNFLGGRWWAFKQASV